MVDVSIVAAICSSAPLATALFIRSLRISGEV
jgi:hypothetical protein